jgi:ribosome maturation factor RimP
MYNDIPAEFRELIEPLVRSHGLELVDALVARSRGSARLNVVLDTPAGDGRVTVGECAAVSRELGHALEAAGAFEGPYLLEVSSPGVDRTLGRVCDFERALGREVALETREPLDGRRNFRGELVAFDGGQAQVRTDNGSFEIPFAQIRRAKAFHPFGPAPSRPAAKR